MHATAGAGSDGAGDLVRVHADADASFADWATTLSDQPVVVDVAVHVTGGFTGVAAGEGRVSIQTRSGTIDDPNIFLTRNKPGTRFETRLTLQPHETFLVAFVLQADVFVGVGFGGLTPGSTADLGNSGYLYMDVATPGGRLATASGRNDSITAIPEPGTWARMLAGVLAVGHAAGGGPWHPRQQRRRGCRQRGAGGLRRLHAATGAGAGQRGGGQVSQA